MPFEPRGLTKSTGGRHIAYLLTLACQTNADSIRRWDI